MGQLRSESSASETEGLERDPKRQKILELKSGKDPGAQVPTDAPNDFSPTGSICSFCQSSKTSEVIFDVHQPYTLFSIPSSLKTDILMLYMLNDKCLKLFLGLYMVKLCRLLDQCCIMLMET